MPHWRAKRVEPIWEEFDDARDNASAELFRLALFIYGITGGLMILASVLAYKALT
jgi:hypothetical protein